MVFIQGWEMHCWCGSFLNLLEVIIVWVEDQSGCGGLSFSCSPGPKDEVCCVVGCCGDVVCVACMFGVKLDGCSIHGWDELRMIACPRGQNRVGQPRGWKEKSGSWVGYCSVIVWGVDRIYFVFVGAFLQFIDSGSDQVAWVQQALFVNDESGCARS
jgi:hypothetical protein